MHTRVSATAVGTPLRWVMWAIPAFLFLIGFFRRAAPGVIAHDLMHAFDATGATIGLLAATYVHSYAALMVPAGLFIDAFGARRVLTAGGVVMGAGALVDGARRYPVEAYRDGFGVCAVFAAAAVLLGLLMRETHGRNIYPHLGGGPLREPA